MKEGRKEGRKGEREGEMEGRRRIALCNIRRNLEQKSKIC
jgi:hypothetical protein